MLERRFLRVCAEHGIPRRSSTTSSPGLEVDFAWPAQGVVVEADGHAFHRTRAAFERDRRRDAALTVAGWRVIRATHARLATDARGVADELRAVLRAA